MSESNCEKQLNSQNQTAKQMQMQLLEFLQGSAFDLKKKKRKKKLCAIRHGASGAAVHRGRASVLLSKGRLFNSPGLHDEVSLGMILNTTLLPMC